MPITLKILLLLTGFVTALISGLFYSYSCSVNPGLKRLPDMEYLHAMQVINRAILNPWFFISFIGTLLLLPVSAWMVYKNEGDSISFYMMLSAALIYLVGVFGVAVFGNVPLNERLDKLNLHSVGEDVLKTLRIAFERPWNSFHFIRTISIQLSLLLTLGSIIVRL